MLNRKSAFAEIKERDFEYERALELSICSEIGLYTSEEEVIDYIEESGWDIWQIKDVFHGKEIRAEIGDEESRIEKDVIVTFKFDKEHELKDIRVKIYPIMCEFVVLEIMGRVPSDEFENFEVIDKTIDEFLSETPIKEADKLATKLALRKLIDPNDSVDVSDKYVLKNLRFGIIEEE